MLAVQVPWKPNRELPPLLMVRLDNVDPDAPEAPFRVGHDEVAGGGTAVQVHEVDGVGSRAGALDRQLVSGAGDAASLDLGGAGAVAIPDPAPARTGSRRCVPQLRAERGPL